jgi:predicted GNAT family N-acyltransferase
MEAVSEKDIKQLSSLHAEEACALVQRVFDATIAPTYQQLGREHWQGKGVGSLLVQKAQERCLGSLDVNAAPGAVSFYQKMGFVPTSEEQETDGIRYIPMRKNFSE